MGNTGPDTDAIMGVINPAIDPNRPPIITGIDPIPPSNTSSIMMDDNMTSSEMDFTDPMDDDNVTESSNGGNETESSNDGSDDTDATADGTPNDENDPPTTPSINAIVDDNSSSSMNHHHLPQYAITITMGVVSIMVAALLHV